MAVCLWQELWEPRRGHLMRQEADGGWGRLPRKGYNFTELYTGKLSQAHQSTRPSFIIVGGKTKPRAHSGNFSVSEFHGFNHSFSCSCGLGLSLQGWFNHNRTFITWKQYLYNQTMMSSRAESGANTLDILSPQQSVQPLEISEYGWKIINSNITF